MEYTLSNVIFASSTFRFEAELGWNLGTSILSGNLTRRKRHGNSVEQRVEEGRGL